MVRVGDEYYGYFYGVGFGDEGRVGGVSLEEIIWVLVWVIIVIFY